MKHIKNIGFTLSLLLAFTGCEQEVMELKAPDTPTDECATATAGSANFSKYIAIGNSLTAGYQAGALFNAGQETSLGKILATQFECAGGGAFVQPSINSTYGFFTGGTNPVDGVVLGRLLLKGNPPLPTPTVSDAGAIPNPIVNPGFLYTGDPVNNFGVPGITLLHMVRPETGNWAASSHPLFNPFYARFASSPGTSTILGDAIGALANGGTFFSFWVGNNDVLGYAIGGASNPAILTPVDPNVDTGHPGFKNLFNAEINAILQVPNVKGVVGNIPNVLALPYFHLVSYNAVALPAANADALNSALAGYNQILLALTQPPFSLPAAEMTARQVAFVAGNNEIIISDETLRDLGPYFDGLLGAGAISAQQRASLEPFRKAREAAATDFITLPAALILGKPIDGNPQALNGVTVPLGDQYVLIPSEQQEIATRTAEFNQIISTTVNASDRLALADIASAYSAFVTAGAAVSNNVTMTPSLAPPTGVISEDGIHANSRGVALMANFFIDGINAKFGSTIPHANVGKYQATAIPTP